jgi:hypothetical protein
MLSSLLSSTTTFRQEWNKVKDALATLLSVLKRPLEHVENYVVSLVEELHNTETLREQMSEAIVTLSTMIEAGVQSIRYKREGILHPLRRLPPEILLQIFHECVAEEVEDLRNQLPFSTVIQSPMILAGCVHNGAGSSCKTHDFGPIFVTPFPLLPTSTLSDSHTRFPYLKVSLLS